ncbi:MAG TPA: tRNA lysidine(34) synthetase TilS [Acidiferrobacter sp.]|nr:tRNA lysidine(34) synthetase TilS [Acidiferrobacter sp.]
MGSLKSARFSSEWLLGALEKLAITRVDPILVGFSGGLDSTALVHALSRVSWPGLRAVYIDHGLHPDAVVWGAQVRQRAGDWGVPCEVLTVEVCNRGQGIEAAARAARYAALAAYMTPQEVLIVAHQADDQAETIMLQLLRGTGLAGAAGMVPMKAFGKGRLARPLLAMTRTALADYVAAEGLSFSEDTSNADRRFARNYIRHEVWPMLARRWPRGHEALARGARHLQAAQRLLESYVEADVARCTDEHGNLMLAPLHSLSDEAQALVLRGWIRRRGGLAPSERGVNAILAALRIVPRSRQQVLRLKCGGVMRRYRDRVSWAAHEAAGGALSWRGVWAPPADYPLPMAGWRLTGRAALGEGLSRNRLDGKLLTVCSRVAGARVYIPGRGHRSLKKLLQELGVAPWDRARAVFVFDAEALIAIPGYWSCRSYEALPGEPGWVLGIETVALP